MELFISENQKKGYEDILTADALSFLTKIAKPHLSECNALLTQRKTRQTQLHAGQLPDFLPATQPIRLEKSWRVKPPPPDLEDRRVEITGPVDAKMLINGLNSGAKVYMADFEDSQSPTWSGLMQGQQNLYHATRYTLTHTNPQGKVYKLKPKNELAVLIVRPRGLHLPETNIRLNKQPIPGAFVDFALHAFHNAQTTLSHNTGPYFYIPKLESHQEARLWANLFSLAEQLLNLPKGTFRATVLIETITAAFEMEEILYELRDYCVGLNCGRWDYIFSYIKKFSHNPKFVLPNREQVGMATHFLNSYSQLLIQTCHRRGAHAMGGMAAQIPIKNNPVANDQALAKVRADKEREAANGHDGTWVAHPGLVPIAMDIFNAHMPTPNQKHRLLETITLTPEDLLKTPSGTITQAGILDNIRAAVHYLAAWISGKGCVPINHLMEDMATAEIARAQLWQWAHHPNLKTDTNKPIDASLIETSFKLIETELAAPDAPRVTTPEFYHHAFKIIRSVVFQDHFSEFLTLEAYPLLNHSPS